LLSTAAQVEAARKNDAEAIALWRRIVEKEGDTPEAPQAELEWARLLRRTGDNPGAAEHLEHMILTYTKSALIPQARRELELAKSAIPPVN
jgi:TolA-binding protein